MNELEVKQAIECMLDKIWRLKIGLSKADKEKMANDIYNQITQELGQTPAGVATESEILAFTSNKGIWIAKENGYYYFWNGSKYEKGLAYQAAATEKNLKIAQLVKYGERTIEVTRPTSTTLSIKIPKFYIVNYDDKTYELPEDVVITKENIFSSIWFVSFNVVSHTFRIIKLLGSTLSKNERILFNFYLNSTKFFSDLPRNYLNSDIMRGELIPNGTNRISYSVVKGSEVTISIKIPKFYIVRYNNSNDYELQEDAIISTTTSFVSTSWLVIFNIYDKTFKIVKALNYKINNSSDLILFSFFYNTDNNIFRTSLSTSMLEEKAAETPRKAELLAYDRKKFKLEWDTKKTNPDYPLEDIILTIPSEFEVHYDDKIYEFPQEVKCRYQSPSTTLAYAVYFNSKTKEVSIKRWNHPQKENEYFLFQFTSYPRDLFRVSGVSPTLYEDNPYNPWNSEDLSYNIKIDAKTQEYSNLNNDSKEIDKFMFFTDLHCYVKSNPNIEFDDNSRKCITVLQKYYNNNSFNFLLNGGDWLNANNDQSYAKFALSNIYGYMNNLFHGESKLLVGNHDTNYQGSGSNPTLSNECLGNLWYNGGKTYYSFKTPHTTYFCFDTGIDYESTMNPYRWEQVDWVCNELISKDPKNSALCMHIWTAAGSAQESARPYGLAVELEKVIKAYNKRESITLNSKTYNFGTCQGKIKFVVAGHTHFDTSYKVDNVPVIITTWARDQYGRIDLPTFDMVYVDYDNSVIKTIRVGAGANREFSMATGKQTK